MNTQDWSFIVELYEYKVDDVLENRPPKGGSRSLRELRDLLTGAPLSGLTLRRFRMADKALRGQSSPVKEPDLPGPQADANKLTVSANMGDPSPLADQGLLLGAAEIAMSLDGAMLPLDSVSVTLEHNAQTLDEEGHVLQMLAEAAWKAEFREELKGQVSKLRGEAGRPTARVLFAAMHNLEQYADHDGFPNDINLAKFRVISRTPGRDDPLASFSSIEVLEDLLEDFSRKLFGLQGFYPDLGLPVSETLSYLRRFALTMAEHPQNSNVAPQEGITAKEIQAAMDEVRRENLSADLKSQMLAKLTQQLNALTLKERDQTSAINQEKQALRHAAETFFAWLTERIPAQWGGKAKVTRAPERLLNAATDSRALTHVSADISEVVVRLTRGGHVILDGLRVGWHNAPEGWMLEVQGAEYPIQVGLRVPAENREVLVYQEGTYIFVRVRRREGGGLWKLLAITRCVAALLEPENDYQALRSARALTGWLRDRRVDAAQHSPDGADRYRSAPEQTLISFARTGAEKLLERFERNQEPQLVERAFAAASEGLREPEIAQTMQRLQELFGLALEAPTLEPVEGLEVRQPDEVIVIAYRGEPITVKVMGRAFTLRTDNFGKVYAIQAGGTGQTLEDILPQRIPGGYALLAREGLRIAIGFMAS